MRYRVNEKCIGCGLCTGICPSVFWMTEDGTAKAMDEQVPDEDIAAAENAKASCPVAAIESVD